MNTKTILVGVVLLLLAPGASLEAREPAEPPPPLIKLSQKPVPPHEKDSSILREVVVEANLDNARNPLATTVLLPLFERNKTLELVQTNREQRGGSVIWSGRVAGQPVSTVIFSAGKEVLIANIATQPTKELDADYYQIRFLGQGVHVLRQIDPSKLPSEGAPTVPALLRGPPTTCSDPANTIDVLVVYTPKARDAAGGPVAMKDAANVYVKEANMSYAQSELEVDLKLNLVDTKVAAEDYVEAGHPKKDLNLLQRKDGKLGEVQDMRDDAAADIVVLIVEYSKKKTDETTCGNAFVMEEMSNAFERFAYAVVPRRCADSSMSFVHEVGHLMGARHDWAVDESEAEPRKPFPFSHGFVHLPKSNANRPAFRTVMATDAECVLDNRRCNRVLFWSNPKKEYPPSGVVMGVSTEDDPERPANNGLTLKETAATVANFRCHEN